MSTRITITDKMMAAIRLTEEFCKTIGFENSLGCNFEFLEDDTKTVTVNVRFVGLPKPHYLYFVLHRCLQGWRLFGDSFIFLHLPDKIDLPYKILNGGENKFRVRFLDTRYENDTTTFEKVD